MEETKKKPDIESTLKSLDTEEFIDIHFYRPIGYRWALFFNKMGVSPNTRERNHHTPPPHRPWPPQGKTPGPASQQTGRWSLSAQAENCHSHIRRQYFSQPSFGLLLPPKIRREHQKKPFRPPGRGLLSPQGESW